MKYNPDLHHRRSIRLRDHDYANAGAYFVTVCCQNRECLFGEIINGKMILNEYGEIAHNELAKTPEMRTNVELCEFVVMPNHIHAIVRITEKTEGAFNTPLWSLQSPSNTVGAIIRGYKSAVSKQIREYGRGVLNTPSNNTHTPNNTAHTPQISIWQRNYWEHIIRNGTEYEEIANYIKNNPILWAKDCFNVGEGKHTSGIFSQI
ncbi:MAG: hypothetical protein LBH25_05730 [Fibromonadaceae bacterium]|jgi:REP element-mobilizing transposase RayT|nr:hypothetical protein [Fibromonadaceae bacterium]